MRLVGVDYAAPGWYFVTVCTHRRQPAFGTVVVGRMRRSALGQAAHDEWMRTGVVRPSVVLDAFVVMPDHVHLLFGIVSPDADAHIDPRVGATRRVAPTFPLSPPSPPSPRPNGPAPGSVGAIIGQYKAAVTRRAASVGGWDGPLWQRSFHDRIVRTEREADAIRRYIAENPARWRPDGPRGDGHRV